MPELTPKSTPRPFPPFPTLPSYPPTLADRWEEFEGFRFTFLRHFTRPEDSEALLRLAQTMYEMVLEHPRQDWPQLGEPETRWEMLAALCDLRFLEGYLTSVYQEHKVSSLPPKVEALSRFAGGIAYDLSVIGDRINEELAKWRTE